MLELQRIDSFDDPALLPYRTMRRQLEQRQQGIFVAEGEKVVRRLLASRFQVISVLLPQKWLDELKPLLEQHNEQVRVFVAEKSLLETLTGFSMYQGLLAVAKVPEQQSLETLLASSPRPWLLLAADGLSNAENIGALIRNCAAFNGTALLAGRTCSSPFLRRAVRASMGTIFELPVLEQLELVSALPRMRRQGIRCIAAHAHSQRRTISQADLAGDCCIVLGSEGYGIDPAVLEQCDDWVCIPISPKVDSLNVANAAAVFLYEANRQRGHV